MSGVWGHFQTALRLHFRNRMALIYGYLFPLVFLAAFAVLYRHEPVPLLRHFGELLTVSVLGGACFGLPTTLVGERERGVWRRYRLTPVPLWQLLASTVAARLVLIASAALLQLGAAVALGMTLPAHPVALVVAFVVVALAFIGLGLVIAVLADTVPAVQALGQCIFLPMLIIGGVAVPLASLPAWAQHVSAFFPGRYAVEALQASITGAGWPAMRFNLFALAVIGGAAAVAGALLFRWDVRERMVVRARQAWLLPVLGAWLAVGVLAEMRGRVLVAPPVPAPVVAAAPPPPPWKRLTLADTARLDFRVPPDEGVVTPIEENTAEDYLGRQVARVRAGLPTWAPAQQADDVQRVRAILAVIAVVDTAQLPVEGYLPLVALEYLRARYRDDDLVKLLTWIAQHPDEGTVPTNVIDLGLPGAAVGDPAQVRERSSIYAVKFIARLTGRSTE